MLGAQYLPMSGKSMGMWREEGQNGQEMLIVCTLLNA